LYVLGRAASFVNDGVQRPSSTTGDHSCSNEGECRKEAVARHVKTRLQLRALVEEVRLD